MFELLPLNLQFFSADTGAGGGSGESIDGGQSSTGTENTETKTDKQQEHMIPKSRFDEVNESYKELKGQLEALQKAQAEEEKKRQAKAKEEAEKRGEYEGLYKKAQSDLEALQGESKSAKERVETLEGIINGLLESKLENIDEEYHDLIPEGMTPEQKLAWVTNAEKKGIFGNKQAQTPLGEQTNPKGNQEVDVNSLNPLQMMMSGYSNK